MSTPTLVFAILSLVLPIVACIYLECTSDDTTRLEKERNQFYSNYYSLWR